MEKTDLEKLLSQYVKQKERVSEKLEKFEGEPGGEQDAWIDFDQELRAKIELLEDLIKRW